MEVIIKSLQDNRINDLCTPVIFCNNRVINYYRKTIKGANFNFTIVDHLDKLNQRQTNVYNIWQEQVDITPGELTNDGGKYAIQSLTAAVEALKDGKIDVLVTAPIHKKNVHDDHFPYTGHTPYLQDTFGKDDVVMLMVAGDFRVGLVTEHVPVEEVASKITKEHIVSKLLIINQSLQRDFDIAKPKIAVLALNPHAGDNGLIGDEEERIIRPAIQEARKHDILIEGPFAADGFFARQHHLKFDAVLAMYHDQGLIPFKSLAIEPGVNYTAGLPIVRTSPDHGTAFDIAGKDLADATSFRAAMFKGIDIFRNREDYDEMRANPLVRHERSNERGH